MDSSSDMPIQPAVAVVRETATRAHPPRLRTSLANESDHVVTVGEGRAVHFEYVIDTGGTFILLPAGPDRSYPARSDCWRLTEAIAVTEEYRTFPIEPGTTSLRHVDLYAIPDSEGCLAVGEYRFQTTISIIDDGERSMSTEWGFSVAVE